MKRPGWDKVYAKCFSTVDKPGTPKSLDENQKDNLCIQHMQWGLCLYQVKCQEHSNTYSEFLKI